MRRLDTICAEVDMKAPYPNKEGFIEFTVMTEASFRKRLKEKKSKAAK